MERIQRMVICGQSIFILAIEAVLAALPEVEVIRVDSCLPAVADRIAGLEPDVVIVERDSGDAGPLSALLERGFPLIELDQTQGVLSVLNRRRVSVQGVEDLAQAFKRIAAIEEIMVAVEDESRFRKAHPEFACSTHNRVSNGQF